MHSKCKTKWMIVALASLVLAAFAGAAFGSSATTLVIAQAEYAFTFDPIFNWADVDRISRLAFDPLLQYDAETKAVVPWVAKSWDISEDGTVYTFYLEEGITFHDGSDLTASDVKYTIERLLALGEGVSRFLEDVTNVEIVDPYTIVLTFSKSNSALLDALPLVYIVSEDGVKANETDGDWAQAYLQDHDLGSGPYEVTLHEAEQRTILSRYSNYWKDWGNNNIEQVIWLWIAESATQRLMLERGEIDISMQPSVADLPDFEANPDIIVHSSPTPIVLATAFRTIREPLTNVLVRKALAMAIDYDYVLDVAYVGYATRAQGPLPSTSANHDPSLPLIEFDLEAAKDSLAAAGYPGGGFTLNVSYESGQEDKVRTMEMLEQNWGALGIDVVPMAADWMAQAAMQLDPNSAPDVYLNYIWPTSTNDAYLLYEFYSSEVKGVYETNSSYWSNPDVDQLIQAAFAATDPAVISQYVLQAQRMIEAALPAASIAERNYVLAARPYVKGYQSNTAHQQSLDVFNMWLDGKP
ncbi:MAG: ABC transporter substrate-binding protein [Candidatus Bipolaricaulota bacterium]